MNKETLKLFEEVFFEAVVIDFDFSKWDKYVRLVVAASVLPADNRWPIYMVDFVDMARLGWDSNHLDVHLPGNEHCQWNIDEFAVEEEDGDLWKITLGRSGSGPGPLLEIWCKDVHLSHLPSEIIASVNPEWRKRPFEPLARPHIEELYQIYRTRR